MLKILHTADWHVGRAFGQFDPEVSRKLARDRVSVIERIMGLAEQYGVDAVLCAGDLFDSPDPGEQWWGAVADIFRSRKHWTKPVVLLPGNHDPLMAGSIYHDQHPFRRSLPEWVHVVDRDDFSLELTAGAIVYAAPCRSTAGDRDLALSLPPRADDDARIRIGLVHGSTFDMAGYTTNFPVSKDAPMRQGLDYLAIGDTHGFREIEGSSSIPIVYPSAPEPTKFGESDAGYVAIVSFRRHGLRPSVRRERVARWTWREITVQSMVELRTLVSENLATSVVKVSLDMAVSLDEDEEVERLVCALRGTDAMSARAGAVVCDRSRLRIVATASDSLSGDLPRAVLDTAAQLQQEIAAADGDQRHRAERALVILKRLLREVL